MKLLRRHKKASTVTSGRSPVMQRPAPQTFSYYNSQRRTAVAPERSHAPGVRLAAAKQYVGRYWHRAPEGVAWALLVISVIYLAFLGSAPKLRNAGTVEFGRYRPAQDYIQAATAALQSSWQNRFKATANPDEIADHLREMFPEISDVSITVPLLGHQPELSLALESPVAELTTNDTERFVILASGGITQATQRIDHLIPIQDNTGIPLKSGALIFTRSQMLFISRLWAQAVASGLKPQQLTIPATPYEVDLSLEGKPYYLKANLQGNADIQIGAYKALEQVFAEQGAPVEYVDVRVEERVFYR